MADLWLKGTCFWVDHVWFKHRYNGNCFARCCFISQRSQ